MQEVDSIEMKIAVSSNHPMAAEWNQKYAWTSVDTSGSTLQHVSEDVLLLDFLQPYFTWRSTEWCDSPELQQVSRRVDCLVKEKNMWTSRSFMRFGSAVLFTHFEIQYFPMKWVYLSGCLDSCQAIIALLFDRGYRYFRILDFGAAQQDGESLLKQLVNTFIGISIELFSVDKLVLQKQEGTLFVFSQSAYQYDEALRQTISYFNFLSVGGAVINLSSTQNEWLKAEAHATQLKYITEKDLYRITEWQVRKQYCRETIAFGDLYV